MRLRTINITDRESRHIDRLRKQETIILIALMLSIITGSITAFAQDCRAVREGSIRLHVIANSDNEADQALKLRVRDEILAEYSALFIVSGSDKAAAKETLESGLCDIAETARQVVREAGRSDDVQAELVRMYFDTRVYNGATMPAGEYDALRITIGEAAGQNWWCVMFPPMCIPAAQQDSDADLEEFYGDAARILEETPKYEIRFALVELFEKIRIFFQNR